MKEVENYVLGLGGEGGQGAVKPQLNFQFLPPPVTSVNLGLEAQKC